MGKSRGEGRTSTEKSQSLIMTPEARRTQRRRLKAEEDTWEAKSGPVVVKRKGWVKDG